MFSAYPWKWQEGRIYPLDNINKYFKDGETRFSLGLEYTRKVWNNKAVAFGFRWQHACYLTTSDNRYEGKLAFYL